jgi:hypothetical protein
LPEPVERSDQAPRLPKLPSTASAWEPHLAGCRDGCRSVDMGRRPAAWAPVDLGPCRGRVARLQVEWLSTRPLSGCDRVGVPGVAGVAIAAWAAVDAGLGGTAKKRA